MNKNKSSIFPKKILKILITWKVQGMRCRAQGLRHRAKDLKREEKSGTSY
jgi:hypothetical protein